MPGVWERKSHNSFVGAGSFWPVWHSEHKNCSGSCPGSHTKRPIVLVSRHCFRSSTEMQMPSARLMQQWSCISFLIHYLGITLLLGDAIDICVYLCVITMGTQMRRGPNFTLQPCNQYGITCCWRDSNPVDWSDLAVHLILSRKGTICGFAQFILHGLCVCANLGWPNSFVRW